jgi:hypothetical protein
MKSKTTILGLTITFASLLGMIILFAWHLTKLNPSNLMGIYLETIAFLIFFVVLTITLCLGLAIFVIGMKGEVNDYA